MLIKRRSGFTLVELMIALTILGILGSILLPQYFEFVQSSRRADAIKSMTRILAQQELFYGNNGSTYTSVVGNLGYADFGGNAQQTESEDGHYVISFAGCGGGVGDCIQLTATPIAGSTQATDYYCTSMAINSRGQTGETYNASEVTPAPSFSCWD